MGDFAGYKMHGNVLLIVQYTFKFVILLASIGVMAFFLNDESKMKNKRRLCLFDGNRIHLNINPSNIGFCVIHYFFLI